MRVTATMFPDVLMQQLNKLELSQNRLQQQAASGQRIRNPEDDPSAVRLVLDLQAESNTVSQYQANIARLNNQTAASYDAMQSLKKISDRVGEIATLADGTKSQPELNAYAAEVTQLIQQAGQLMNTKFQDNYLFAGTLSDTAPFVVATGTDGTVTSVTYQGNTSANEVEIAEGVTLATQMVGANTTGSGPHGLITDSRTGADFFAHMISLQNHLLAGDVTSITSTDIPNLGADEKNLITQISAAGAISARLEAAAGTAEQRTTLLEKTISDQADADLAQVLVQLTQAQNAYKAALQSGATILNLSLLDFLK